MTENVRLLTILEWAEQHAAGKDCAQRRRWLAESPEAQRQWDLVLQAQHNLDGGQSSPGIELLSAEQVAEFLEGRLDLAAIRDTERACWRSPAQMAEVLSAVRFERQMVEQPQQADLGQRLLALETQPAARNGVPRKLPVSNSLEALDSLPVVTPAIRVRPRRAMPLGWPQVAAAAALAAGLLGVVCWLIWTLASPAPGNERMAREPVIEGSRPAPRPQPAPGPAPLQRPEPHNEQPRLSPQPSIAQQPVQPPAPSNAPAQSTPPLEAIVPAPRENHPQPQPPDELTIECDVGLLLVDADQRGSWRAAQGRQSVNQSIKLVCLPESFSTLTVPRLGTLILSGPVDATLSRQRDRSWLLRLDRGRLAVRGVAAGQRLHFLADGVSWTAQGVGESSIVALAGDPATPSLFVPQGAVAVEGVEVSQGQVARLAAGAWLPPESLSAMAQPVSPVLDNGLEGRWLQGPDDQQRREWKSFYGRLADRVAAADDAGAAIGELFDSTRDLRQAALLALWRLSTAEDPRRVELVWDTLNDRREPVRQAAVRHLLELPQHDQRTVNTGRYLRIRLGNETASHVVQWLAATRANQPLAGAQAVELVESLMHAELSVRQIGLALLELHTRSVFERQRRKPPVYDAAASASRRLAGQREWRQLINRLYSARDPASLRGARGLAPAAPPNAAQQGAP
jgi:hypothetical protein